MNIAKYWKDYEIIDNTIDDILKINPDLVLLDINLPGADVNRKL